MVFDGYKNSKRVCVLFFGFDRFICIRVMYQHKKASHVRQRRESAEAGAL